MVVSPIASKHCDDFVECLNEIYAHLSVQSRVETGLDYLGNPGHPGHVFSGSSGSDPLYKISRSDQDSALDHLRINGIWEWPK